MTERQIVQKTEEAVSVLRVFYERHGMVLDEDSARQKIEKDLTQIAGDRAYFGRGR